MDGMRYQDIALNESLATETGVIDELCDLRVDLLPSSSRLLCPLWFYTQAMHEGN